MAYFGLNKFMLNGSRDNFSKSESNSEDPEVMEQLAKIKHLNLIEHESSGINN